MKTQILQIIFLLIVSSCFAKAQDTTYCILPDTLKSVTSSMTNTTMNVVMIFVDFPEGRKPGSSLPTVDADTSYFHGDTINSVGSMGWAKDPFGVLQKKIRKYTYDDWWDKTFSVGQYYGSHNPDSASHGRLAYGSVKEYWTEVSYGNLTIQPYQTWSGTADKYHTGIVNHIDTASGKNYIRWIKLPRAKSTYSGSDPNLYIDALRMTDSLHHISTSDPNYIEFDTTGYSGKIMFVVAGPFKGGFTPGHPSKYIIVQEKYQIIANTSPQSFLSPIREAVHEFGHSIGLDHVVAGTYDVMNHGFWPGAPAYEDCPPHINPLSKITLGWINYSDIARVRSNGSVSLTPTELPPSGSSPIVALITVYGDAGRDSLWNHSEYFLVEYRSRQGFNRFTGGVSAPSSFHGGALIWHYSSFQSMNIYSDINQSVNANLALKVANYFPANNHTFGRDLGDTTQFYPSHGTALDSLSTPSSQSAANLTTGISLNSFTRTSSLVSFNVNYQIAAPPTYSVFSYTGGPAQSIVWSGNVYLQALANYDSIKILPGTSVDILQSNSQALVGPSFRYLNAAGTDSLPIKFHGVGYQNYRTTGWLSFALKPTPSTSRSTIQYCIFTDYFFSPNAGGQAFWLKLDSSNGITPLFKKNQFLQPVGRIIAQGSYSPSTVPLDLSWFDTNIFPQLEILGRWKLDSSTTFTLPSSTLMYLSTTSSSTDTTVVNLFSGHTMNINGRFRLYGNTTYYSRMEFQSNSTLKVQTNGRVDLYPGTTLKGNGTINVGGTDTLYLNSNSNIVFPSGIRFELQKGNTINWGTNTALNFYDSVNVKDSATFTVGSTGTLRGYSTSKFLFGTQGTLTVNGKISAIGTSSQSIPFTSNKVTTSPGDWYGIKLLNGPDTLKYCTVKYAQYGVSVNTTTGVQIQNSTISNNSVDGIYEYNSNASGALTIQNSTLTYNSVYGLEMYNAWANVNSSTTISHSTSTGIHMAGGASLNIDNSTIQYNSGSGVVVSGSGTAAYFAANGAGSGFNTITDNTTSQVFVESGGSALLGYKYQVCEGPSIVDPNLPVVFSQCNSPNHWVWHQTGGANTIDGTYGDGYYFVYNSTGTVVHADINYWPQLCPPDASAFYGSVSRDYPLCDDPTNHLKDPPEVSGAPILGTGGSTPELKEMYALINHCKNLIESNPDSADITLPMLAVFASPHGRYPDVLGMPWENFLANIEQNSVSSKLKKNALVYKIHSRLERKDYSSVFSLTDDALQHNPSDRIWLFCQLEKVAAYVDMGDIASAEALYASLRSRGESIDVHQVRSLRRMLNATQGIPSQPDTGNIGGSQFVKVAASTGAEKPRTYELFQNTPNPFNPTTVIQYTLPEDGKVTLKIYNVLGEEVSSLVDEFESAGFKSVSFDATTFPSGMYFYRLQAGKFSDVKKMLLLK